MINEEDHLRIQVMHSGLDLQNAWEQIDRIDTLIGQQVTFAYHAKLGFLTACPTNVGTGVRVSVMLHLPALVITRQIDKVFRSLQKISLAVRGLYGEGSQAMGDFYQISNQITLGKSEIDLVKQVSDIVPVLIDYERRARDFLVRESHENLHDKVSRAYGILRTAQTISSEETMHLLSSVRMGVNLGLIHDLQIPMLNERRRARHRRPQHRARPLPAPPPEQRRRRLREELRRGLHPSAFVFARIAVTTARGTKRESSSSPAMAAICLISELETWEYCSSAIRKTVSICASSLRLAAVMVNSVSMSPSERTPRSMTRAPH